MPLPQGGRAILLIGLLCLLCPYRIYANTLLYSQKFYKLKRESEKMLGDTDASTTTPKSAKAGAKKGAGSESAGTKRKKNTATNDEETPTKRSKKSAAQLKAEVKAEEEAEESVKAEELSDAEDELSK